jgi:hypothetical protein
MATLKWSQYRITEFLFVVGLKKASQVSCRSAVDRAGRARSDAQLCRNMVIASLPTTSPQNAARTGLCADFERGWTVFCAHVGQVALRNIPRASRLSEPQPKSDDNAPQNDRTHKSRDAAHACMSICTSTFFKRSKSRVTNLLAPAVAF